MKSSLRGNKSLERKLFLKQSPLLISTRGLHRSFLAGNHISFQTFVFIFFLSLFFSSCGKNFHPQQADTGYYQINNAEVDSFIIRFIQPYRDSLLQEMSEVIALSDVAMEKAKPESRMGNFIADLLLEEGRTLNNGKGDICIVNYGGLRVPLLPAGNITKGMIFELMPFDNFLVALELKGTVVQQLLDHIAAQGGWPIAGVRFKIFEGKASEILINNEPLKEERIYEIIISDYLADGGDNLLFLRPEKKFNTGVFLRDAILEYLRKQTQAGKIITTQLDNRHTLHE